MYTFNAIIKPAEGPPTLPVLISISKGKSNLSFTVVARNPTIGSPLYSTCSMRVVSTNICFSSPFTSLSKPMVTVSPILYVLKVDINSVVELISLLLIEFNKSPFFNFSLTGESSSSPTTETPSPFEFIS